MRSVREGVSEMCERGSEWSLNVDASLNLNSVQSAELKKQNHVRGLRFTTISLLLLLLLFLLLSL